MIRTIIEFTTHIEFVIEQSDDEKHKTLVKDYLDAFFRDSQRIPGMVVKAQVQQKLVHEVLGKGLDEIAETQGEIDSRIPAATLYWNSYRAFSNYVHGKYPEIMDLYGGTPARFHLRGMSGTPKDQECIQLLDSFVTTAVNTFIQMIQRLELKTAVLADPVLGPWYQAQFD